MKLSEIEKPNIPYYFARKHGMLAMFSEQFNQIVLYHLPNPSLVAINEVQRLLQTSLRLIEVNEHTFQEYLSNNYQSQSSVQEASLKVDELDLNQLAHDLPTSEDLLDTQDDAPIIRLLNALFTQAIKQNASDIHIETYESRVLVRYRIDGVLQEILDISRSIAPLVISRVKVMAKLDISEKRIPQDGRIALKIGDHSIDVRVSTLPSNHGERVVLRILDKKTAQLDLSLLGMQKNELNLIKKLIAQPHGILLVTGPTGSGKTTSLYAMLTELNEVSRNILTIEDPIEYDLPGIGQTQVNNKVQMTFAKGLRAILRQDPDIVMIGEIRDLETAEIAVQASLTGHLVLSTLHTNTAVGALSRLRDMGVESFLIASSLNGLIAQRLVRKLCTQCKVSYQLNDTEIKQINIPDSLNFQKTNIFKADGCTHCNQTGYQGRMGIYEIIMLDDEIRSMIYRQEDIQTIMAYVRPTMPSIRESGFKLVLQGKTSITEILRVTNHEST